MNHRGAEAPAASGGAREGAWTPTRPKTRARRGASRPPARGALPDRRTVPVLLFDAACGFCRRWVERWAARTGDGVLYAPAQTPGLLRALGIPPERARRASLLVEPRTGRVFEGADAVLRAVGHAPELRALTALALAPGVRGLAHLVYRGVARQRIAAARADHLLFGESALPPQSCLVRAAFLAGLGGVSFIAFTSLRRQVLGLYGSGGLHPLDEILGNAKRRIGRERLWKLPSLFWFGASDRALVRACEAGQLASVALLTGFAPRWSAATAWALYLSFTSVGGEFLRFQWDSLLLESLVAAFVVAPPGVLPGLGRHRPTATDVALLRWLAFRLHFESGLAKLRSGDATWRERSACSYYFETAPLPTRAGWYAHHLPASIQRFSTRAALLAEAAAPLLVFAPRRPRRAGFPLFSVFQGLIAATGNYGFFNLLTAVLMLAHLDDEAIAPTWLRRTGRAPRAPWPRRLRSLLAAIPLAAFTASDLLDALGRTERPRRFRRWVEACRPFELSHAYGLFSVMTTRRPEIVIEGSEDAVTWTPYELPYKPGDPARAPRLSAPHQPRLDWQLWFAAMGPPPVWFHRLMVRLLEGSPEVLALFARAPFDGRTPRYVRADLYLYRMLSLDEHLRTGLWWGRERIGRYYPPVTLATSRPTL